MFGLTKPERREKEAHEIRIWIIGQSIGIGSAQNPSDGNVYFDGTAAQMAMALEAACFFLHATSRLSYRPHNEKLREAVLDPAVHQVAKTFSEMLCKLSPPLDTPSLKQDVIDLFNARDCEYLVGIEACPLSEWLYGALIDSGFTTICIETRHAQRFLSSRPNKTDRSDARGIADMMRLGHYRPVHVKSREAQLLRTTLIARRKFVTHMLAIEQTIRGLLKVYGLKLGQVHRCTFAAKVRGLLENKPELELAIEPLLEARNVMRRQHMQLDRHLSQIARKDEVCRRLMTISGVGPIVSLAFKATVDDPTRFKNSKAVAAHLGLTPRVYQSGELDLSGHISKCGDRFMRHALYEAANSHLRISKKWSSLRAWGLKLGKRVGMKKACVAVARKLAIIMHRMWLDERDFQYGRQTTAAAAR